MAKTAGASARGRWFWRRDAAAIVVAAVVFVVTVAPTLLLGANRPASRPAATLSGAGRAAASPVIRSADIPSRVPAALPGTSVAVRAEVVERAIVPWADQFGVLHVEVIVGVRNTGRTPAQIVPEETPYEILGRTGAAAIVGRFSVAIPRLVAANATGYLVDSISAPNVRAADLDSLTLSVAMRPATVADRLLAVRAVSWSSSAAGAVASGVVTNQTGSVAPAVGVLVLARDRLRHVIAAVYDVADLPRLSPGDDADFKTSFPGAPPVSIQSLASTDAIAAGAPPTASP